MTALRLVVVGAASSYTPELFANLTEPGERLPVEQVTLMDLNAEKLAFVAGVCRRLLAAAGSPIRVETATALEPALAGADFVLAQIRVGGLAARVRDEQLPMAFGLVGNETTGAGGFVCALRTLPALLAIARTLERVAPGAWLLNMSNPAGIVTEALLKHTRVRVVGFCNIPINTTYALAEVLDVPPAELQLDSFGLNHLSWTRAAYLDGRELLQPLIHQTHSQADPLYQRGIADSLMDLAFLHDLAMIPGWYLRYFYYPDRVLAEDRQSAETKGQRDMQAEAELRRIYAETGYDDRARAILKSKGGAQYYLPVLAVIRAVVEDSGARVIADVRNGRCLPELPPDVCVEVPARFGRDGAEPLPIGPLPLSVRGLVQAVKAYEELTIEAALTGDRGLALAALRANPLVGAHTTAQAFFERVLANERDYLHPAFFGAAAR